MTTVSRILVDAWYRREPWLWLLRPLEWLGGALVLAGCTLLILGARRGSERGIGAAPEAPSSPDA